jgi:hypothetical protein
MKHPQLIFLNDDYCRLGYLDDNILTKKNYGFYKPIVTTEYPRSIP